MATLESELKAAIGAKTALFGYRQTAKNLKLGKIKKIIVAANCPAALREELEHNAKLEKKEKVEIAPFDKDSAELGAVCGVPFKVAVVGIKR